METGNQTTRLEAIEARLTITQNNLDDFFMVISAILVFAMQMGFSFMETGLVRSKNATNILMKSTLDAFIGAIAYWLIGYAFAYGEGNDFIGWTGFALQGVPPSRLSFWFYQTIFANTASTITSGAVAERMNLPAFFTYSFLLTGVMYPMASRWAWLPNGWLKQRGFIDFGGSGVVHMLGGVCALVATLFVGPRIGNTATAAGKSKHNGKNNFRGHSMTLTGIGAFLLMFGIMGYNMSSQASLSKLGDGSVVALSAVNTLIAGSAGAIAALVLGRATPTGKYRWSYLTMLNGSIAGMVSSCAGCNAMPIWAAYVTGTGAGLTFFALRTLLHKCAVDDALDAFAVHFGGGVFGMFSAPMLIDSGVLLLGDAQSAQVMAIQVAGMLVLIAWGGGFCCLLFGALKWMKILRVEAAVEIYGMDMMKHDEPAYPADSWEEQQYWDYQLTHLVQVLHSNYRANRPAVEQFGIDIPAAATDDRARIGLPPQMNFAHLVLKDQLEKCVLTLGR